MKRHLVLSSLLGVSEGYGDMSRNMLLHYRQWPISELVLTLNGSEADIWEFRRFLRDVGIRATVFGEPGPYDNRRQSRWSSRRQDYIRQHYSERDWKISVDSDEIVEFSQELLEVIETADCSYVLGFIVDMLPTELIGPLGEQAARLGQKHTHCFLTQAIALAQKVPLARAHVLLGGAAHDVARRYRTLRCFRQVLAVYHYKWELGIHTRLRERAQRYRDLGIAFADESLLYLDRLRTGVSDLIVDDLNSTRLSIGPDKTGGRSLQLDPRGQLSFFGRSRAEADPLRAVRS